MNNRTSVEGFNPKELKEQLGKMKEEYEKSRTEYDENGNKVIKKMSFKDKIIGVFVALIIIACIGFAIWDNISMMFLPKNSITIIVSDQNDESISGLRITLRSSMTTYDEEFNDVSSVTILGAKPGDYVLTFDYVPSGYSCSYVNDEFTLNQDAKVKLEYKCNKEN